MHVNMNQPDRFVEKVVHHFGDDLRANDSPSGVLHSNRAPMTCVMRRPFRSSRQLIERGATIAAYDPEAMEEAKRIFGSRIQFCANNYACLEGADALAVGYGMAGFPQSQFRANERT